MTDRYARERTKLMKMLADHFHDKALETSVPSIAARWVALMDTMLWMAYGDGDSADLEQHFDKPETPHAQRHRPRRVAAGKPFGEGDAGALPSA